MNKPLCSAVDTSLFIDTNGEVRLCCPGEYLGSLKHASIDEIFQSQKYLKVKEALYNGQWPKYCDRCTKIEKQAPGSGYFHHMNEHYPSNSKRELKHLDIRWNNVCNLSCRYCNPNSSSQWMKVVGMPVDSVKKDYTIEVLQYIEQNKHTITGVSLLGGEPFLQKPNEKLFEILDPNTRVDIITNLSVDLESNKIYNLVKKFPNIYFNISFENVGDRFEYVRSGASWEKLKHNIKLLQKDFGRHVGCLAVYDIWSACNLEEFYDFCNENNMPVAWQLAQYDGCQWSSDGFVVPGHNQKVIGLALDQINIVLKKYKALINGSANANFLTEIQHTLANATVDPSKGYRFLRWIEQNEFLIPPKKHFVELWPLLVESINNPK